MLLSPAYDSPLWKNFTTPLQSESWVRDFRFLFMKHFVASFDLPLSLILRSFPKHFLPPSLLQRLIEIAEERREGTGEGEILQLTPPNCLLYEEISNGKPSLIPWVSRAWLWQLPIRDCFLQSVVAIFTVIYNNAKKGASWRKICKGLSLKLTKKYTS